MLHRASQLSDAKLPDATAQGKHSESVIDRSSNPAGTALRHCTFKTSSASTNQRLGFSSDLSNAYKYR